MGERTLTASRPHGGSLPSLLPLWEKVAVGGLRPPFFNRTPMLRIGYAKSVPDEGLRRSPIDRNPSPVSNFATLIRATLSHKGRGKKKEKKRAALRPPLVAQWREVNARRAPWFPRRGPRHR